MGVDQLWNKPWTKRRGQHYLKFHHLVTFYTSLFNIFERKRNLYRRNTPKNMEKTWKFGALYPIEVIKSQFINSKTLHIILILYKNTIQKKVITLQFRLHEKMMRIAMRIANCTRPSWAKYEMFDNKWILLTSKSKSNIS